MSTPHLSSLVRRLAIAAACLIASASCGSELIRGSRSPVYLVIMGVQGASGNIGGGGLAGNSLLSDVVVLVDELINGRTVRRETVFNDNVTVTVRALEKNQSATLSTTNIVSLTRYRVNFRRSDGRSTPGVDVPYGFDGGLSRTFSPGEIVDVSFVIVRHQAKLEPPLMQLRGLGGLGFISTTAEITLWGRDQNGNELTATAFMDVHFGDFGD